MHPGEVFAAIGGLLICIPYIQHLCTTPKTPIKSIVWQLWAIGYLLIDVYYENHISGGHQRHHHVITDIVHSPHILSIVFPVAALLAWACLVRDKMLLGEFCMQEPLKARALKIARWCGAPATICAIFMLLVHLAKPTFKNPGMYNFLLSIIGITGSAVYATGGISAIKEHRGASNPMIIIPQMLGFLVLGLNTLLIYKVVDWKGLSIVACMFFSNLILALSSLIPDKYRFQDKQQYELVDNGDKSDKSDLARTSTEV